MVFGLITPSPRDWAEKTNIVRYAERQAQSCQYLERVFGEISSRTRQLMPGLRNGLDDLFAYLLGIHRRQYEDLAAVIPIPQDPDRKSYYFETMYRSFGLSPITLPENIGREDLFSILAIQAISYMRGRDRYDALRIYRAESNLKFIPVWSKFFWDATGNTEKVVNLMQHHYLSKNLAEKINQTILAEDKMMKNIWKHDGVNF